MKDTHGRTGTDEQIAAAARAEQDTGVGRFARFANTLSRRAQNLMNLARHVAYRTPVVNNVMFPKYGYWVDPGELAAMVALIDATRSTGGAVVEIGVARGYASVFFLEHLRTTGDPRTMILIDTFGGFTPESVAHEVDQRKKGPSEIVDFSYGSVRIFNRSLARLGYTNYRIVQGDCSQVDWTEIGPIGAVFLDVDLYLPTAATLEAIWPQIVPGGGIVIDDCLPGRWCDGAYEAYCEFIERHSLPHRPAGGKGALVQKPVGVAADNAQGALG